MSSEIAIQARKLSKCYPIFDRPEDRLKQMLFRGRRKYYREFWAVRDVDLDIYKGETVGIVGRNGSGKSTLLQLISGTLAPTSGELRVNGRVAALLELGAGFNPEFTGRENVYTNGSILGIDRAEMENRFEKITAFADIGPFIDQPVKSYSSGMFARLAFAVAINVDPEILVVDEALSVGDEAFQRKCFARIAEIRELGGTILFVSHAAATVVELCDRAVLLDQGERLLLGTPKVVVSLYQRLLYAPHDQTSRVREEILASERDPGRITESTAEVARAIETQERPLVGKDEDAFDENLLPATTTEYASRGAEIFDVHIKSMSGKRVNVLSHGLTYRYCYSVSFCSTCFSVRFGMLFKTVTGVEIGGQLSHGEGQGLSVVEAGETIDVTFEFVNRLSAGTYFCNAGVIAVDEEGQSYAHRVLDAMMLRVKPCESRGSIPTAIVDLKPSDETRVGVQRVSKSQKVAHS